MHDLDHEIGDVIEQRRLPGYLGVAGVDAEGTFRYISPELDGRWGISLGDAIGRSFVEFVDEDDLAQVLYSFDGVSDRAGHHQALQLGIRDQSGELRRCDVVAENCLDEPGIGLVLLNLADADDRLRSNDLLAVQADVVRQLALGRDARETIGPVLDFLERALPGFASAVYLTDDLVAGVATVSRRLPSGLADRIAAAIRDDAAMPGAIAINGNEAIVASNIRGGRWPGAGAIVGDACEAVWSMPIRHEHGGDSYGLIEVYGPHPAHPQDSDWVTLRLVSRLAAIGVDRLRLQEQMIAAADVDPLTSTPNRRALTALLDSLVGGDDRGRAVCFIDLDRLKIVNDGLGHEAGDQLIRASARRLVLAIGDSGTVGRFGGDEFVAVASDESTPAIDLAERCLAAFDEPIIVAGHRWRITASIGAVQIDGHQTAGEVLRDADAAMYEAKRSGRNRYHLFDAVTRDAVVRRMHLERQIADAIERDEIEAYFQPVVRCADWLPYGLETLARWPDSGDPWVPPSDFVPLLEELGLIDLVGIRMIDRALGLVDRLRDRVGADCCIAVNVSPLQLLSSELFEFLETAVDEGRPVADLCLEMTEQHMIDDSEQTLHALERLLATGVHLAVDDFGTGYSSLGALHRLPAQTLKIDRHLVERLDSERGRSVVAAVVGVAKAFEMATVAEGVETAEQALALRAIGVDAVQGFLFARPDSVEAVMERLTRPRPWDVAPADLVD